MNPKLRALLWEQSRVAGVLTLWCLGMFLLALAVFQISRPLLSLADRREMIRLWIYATLVGLPLMFLLRQNAAGHLDAHFDGRLARLPVSTAALTFIPLLTRVACIVLYFLSVSALCRLTTGTALSAHVLLLLLTAYLLVQAIAWAESRLLYLSTLLGATGLLVYFLLRTIRFLPRWNLVAHFFSDRYAEAPSFLFAGTCAALIPAALGLAWLAVAWERRNEHFRFLPPVAWWEGLQEWLQPRAYAFASPVPARVWFERAGTGLPLLRLAVPLLAVSVPLVAFGISMASIPLNSILGQQIVPLWGLLVVVHGPYLAVAVTMAVLGAIREYSRSMWPLSLTGFTTTRPVHAQRLAWAHILVMTRRAFIMLLLALVVSTVLYATVFPDVFHITTSALRHTADPVLSVGFFLGPLFWGCIFTWLALWCIKPIFFAALVLFFVDLLWMLTAGHLLILAGEDHYLFLYLFCLFVLARSGNLLAYAWKNHILSRPAWATFVSLHFILALFIWWPGPPERIVGPDALFVALAFVALVLSPILAVPKAVVQKRVIS